MSSKDFCGAVTKLMDHPTLAYYNTHAPELAARYEQVSSIVMARFESTFTKGSKLLDIGCGSGRDLALLARMGFDVYGVDPSAEFIQLAQQTHPELKGRLSVRGLPDLGIPFEGNFDGVLCYGVLMHLSPEALIRSAQSLRACLKRHGRVIIAIPAKKPGIDTQNRDEEGRLFQLHRGEDLQSLFASNSFDLIEQWSNQDSIDETGIEWLAQSYELTSFPADW
jgi:2-polyprenyl-3-methyl-5-hydroxy-6-metoxy-1,4-benzoquinol methylase